EGVGPGAWCGQVGCPTRNIGGGARYGKDAVVRPGGEAQPLLGRFKYRLAAFVDVAPLTYLPGAHLCGAMEGCMRGVAPGLSLTCEHDTVPYGSARFRRTWRR